MYHKKRNAFNKTSFNPNHIESQSNYLKDRKNRPKLDLWENPPFDWPPKLPRPTMHKGKALLLEVDKEERDKVRKEKNFLTTDFRSGDVLKVTMIGSVSENKDKEFTGLCISKSMPNNIRARCKINMNLDQVNTTLDLSLYSPHIKNLEIVKYGSNQLRKKLSYIPSLDLPKTILETPIIKGKNFKNRTEKSK